MLLISTEALLNPLRCFSIILGCFSTYWSAYHCRCCASKFPWGASHSHWVAFEFYGDDFWFQRGSSNFHWSSSQSIEPVLNSLVVLLISIAVLVNFIKVLPCSIELIYQFFCVDSQFQWSTSQIFLGCFSINWGAFQFRFDASHFH